MTASHISPDRNELSKLSEEVVKRIEEGIEVIRSTPSFGPNSKEIPSEYPLYTKLQEKGLVQSISDVGLRVLQATGRESILQPDSSIELSERSSLVRNVLLPSLESLWCCYQFLDENSCEYTKGRGGKNQDQSSSKLPSPPPPPGLLLSLRNYTDIACWMELTVATCILPLIDSNILYPPRSYARTLPKSLTGRLPARSLIWWCSSDQQPKAGSTSRTTVQPHETNVSLRTIELQEAAIVLTNFVTLDRFRPMLLPRHLLHLYAAALQVLQLQNDIATPRNDNYLEQSWQSTLCVLGLVETPTKACFDLVDLTMQARTYQTLLSQGLSVPLWLRRIAGKKLSSMPLRVLLAVYHGDGAAALRLARAIISGITMSNSADSANHTDLTERIKLTEVSRDIASLLDELSVSIISENNLNQGQRFVLETLWALIDMLKPKQRALVIGTLCSGDKYSEWMDQLSALTAYVPRFIRFETLGHVLLCPTELSPCLFDMTLRLAASQTVLHSPVKERSSSTLRRMVHALLTDHLPYESSSTVASVALISACWNDWDEADSVVHVDQNPELELVPSQIFDEKKSSSDKLNIIEERSRVLSSVLMSLGDDADDTEILENKAPSLVSDLFLMLLALFVESNWAEEGLYCFSPTQLRQLIDPMVPMLVLPQLCESLPLDSILAADTSLLAMMHVVFHSAASLLREESNRIGTETGQDQLFQVQKKMTEGTEIYLQLTNTLTKRAPKENAVHLQANDLLLFSICSILLNILVSILELGVAHRSDIEEKIIQSFRYPLSVLANGEGAHVSNPKDRELSDLFPVFNELASHALALVAARSAPVDLSVHFEPIEDNDSVGMDEVERELNSSEPPLRARAVVRLRHLAGALLDCHTDIERSIDPTRCSRMATIWDCTRLCLKALSDSESFVYLAAIQTFAAMVTDIGELRRAIGLSVVSGILCCGDGISSELTTNQRVKLVEVLICVVRRKAAVDETLNFILDVMIFGTHAKPENSHQESAIDTAMIHNATHEFFLQQHEPRDSLSLKEENWDAMDVRINTGGPLFVSEEDDALRAGKLILVSEILSKIHPSTASVYCAALTQCAIDTVRLEEKRMVRRGGAVLARELYSLLLREYEYAYGYKYAIKFVNGSEEILAVTLERCCNCEDLGEGRSRYFDPATVARSKEALALRNEAYENGIFTAASIAANSKELNGHVQSLLGPAGQDKHISEPTATRRILIEEIE